MSPFLTPVTIVSVLPFVAHVSFVFVFALVSLFEPYSLQVNKPLQPQQGVLPPPSSHSSDLQTCGTARTQCGIIGQTVLHMVSNK